MTFRAQTAIGWVYVLTALFRPSVWREAWRGANRRVEARFASRRPPVGGSNVGGAPHDSNMHSKPQALGTVVPQGAGLEAMRWQILGLVDLVRVLFAIDVLLLIGIIGVVVWLS